MKMMTSLYFGTLFVAFVLLYAVSAEAPAQGDFIDPVGTNVAVAARAALIFGDQRSYGAEPKREKRAVAMTAMAVFAGMTLLSNVVKDIPTMIVDTNDETRIPIHCSLAASVGSLTSDSIKLMDDEMKIMISGTLRVLGKKMRTLPRYPTWEQVISIFNQNVLIEQIPGSQKRSRKTLSINENNWFKLNGDPEDDKVRRVKDWFENTLVDDGDVIADTQIDINAMGRIVGSTGATVSNFLTFFAKTERHTRTVFEIGVLRFPDIDHPYFKVYRIKLVAFSESKRILFHQRDRNGIVGSFDSIKYRPRSSVMNGLRPRIRAKAVEEAEDIFG